MFDDFFFDFIRFGVAKGRLDEAQERLTAVQARVDKLKAELNRAQIKMVKKKVVN